MNIHRNTMGLGIALALCAANTALAQTGLPTSQPNVLHIYREEVKVGHAADHEKTEAGWPAAFEKAKSPYYYIALVSLTGAPEAWFVAPFESHAAIAESMKFERGNAALSAELTRLSREDAAHLNGLRIIQATARKDLSYGEYPDMTKQRFYQVTTFRVRPGREGDFAAAAKAYGGAASRAGTPTAFRVYQVAAGMPTPTFLIFSSLTSFGELDKGMSNSETIQKAMTDEDRKVFDKFFGEGLINSDTQRFEVNPTMSYVSPEARASDPFWMPKKPAAKKTTTAPAAEPKGPKSPR